MQARGHCGEHALMLPIMRMPQVFCFAGGWLFCTALAPGDEQCSWCLGCMLLLCGRQLLEYFDRSVQSNNQGFGRWPTC